MMGRSSTLATHTLRHRIEMALRDSADIVLDWVWRRCEDSVVWFTAMAASVAFAVFCVGYGIVVLIWR